jgi:hypothetical protein
MGPTDGPESRREHAFAFVKNALLPGATRHMKEIARDVALSIIEREVPNGRSSPNARRDQILVDTVELVCKTYNLHPTRRSGQAESGCSIVAEALPKFLVWLRKYPDELLGKLPDRPRYRELRNFADTTLPPREALPRGRAERTTTQQHLGQAHPKLNLILSPYIRGIRGVSSAAQVW